MTATDSTLERAVGVLDGLPEGETRSHLLACCGCRRWADDLVASRPFASVEALVDRAVDLWRSLERDEILEAFAAHPDIGDRSVKPSAGRQGWSAQEQSGAAASDDQVQEGLALANRAYAERFGYRFIVCATGKSGREMLEILERRLANDPATELPVAAAEQEAILRLRLAKLLEELASLPDLSPETSP